MRWQGFYFAGKFARLLGVRNATSDQQLENSMSTAFLTLKTDPALLSKLEHAAERKPTPSEMLEQRVSFVYGSLKDSSGVSRERVRQVILEQTGTVAGATK